MPTGQLGNALRHLRQLMGGPGGDATDRDLLRRYADDRDEDAFRLLVRRHGPMVLGVCRRILGANGAADDAFQIAFLVLARKAGTTFWRESVASWLYGVAYRTAQKVRTSDLRRARHEQGAAALQPTAVEELPEARELRQVLDTELQRLPERFRLPVLLCCLQDQTVDEAAQHLGWTFATVKSRLQRGREMLRTRLQRRGIELSAGVLAALVTPGVVGAVPPSLTSATMQAVFTGPLAAPVDLLLKGVLRAMMWNQLKFAVLVVAALGLIVSGVGVAVHLAAGEVVVDAVAVAPDAQAAPAITGTAVDEAGKPVPGAEVWVFASREAMKAKPREPLAKAKADKNGVFTVEKLPARDSYHLTAFFSGRFYISTEMAVNRGADEAKVAVGKVVLRKAGL